MIHVDIAQQPQSIISLCPGIRGIERALEGIITDLTTVAYVEIEAFIIQNLVWAMEQGMVAPAPIWSDVKTFDARPFRGKVHGLIGGYPCQPFSNAGARKGTEDPRHLWPFIRESIRAGEFIWCLFENVAGHLTMGYDVVYKDLRDLGYDVEAGLYTASEVGAPHQRERLFILAVKRGYKLEYSCLRNEWDVCGESGTEHSVVGHSGNELGNTEHDGCNGPQNGEGAKKGSDRDESRSLNVKQLEGSGSESDGGDETVADSCSKSSSVHRHEQDSGQGREPESGVEREVVRQGIGTFGSEGIGTSCEDELAHTHSIGHLHQQFGEQPTEAGEYAQCNATASSGDVADTNSQRHGRNHQGGFQPETIGGGNGEEKLDRWPARPGQPQYDWEEPRTVKPKVGSTVNGYNFREDFLRALGNAVVEQTAALAFIDLINKHNSK